MKLLALGNLQLYKKRKINKVWEENCSRIFFAPTIVKTYQKEGYKNTF
jgi:hypothetical protein